jgi:hypothetical protein
VQHLVHSVGRVLTPIVLLAAVVGAGIHYDAAEPAHCPYPTEDTLGERYDPAVGNQALLLGEVRSIDTADNTAVITVEHDTGTFEMRVTGIQTAVEPSGVVQVYGTLQPGHTIAAQSTVVVNPAGSSTTYKYAVSVVGALLVLAVFFRRWRFDTETRGFVPREERDG